jgi:DNA-binding MarR family transcriptional regulator
LRKKAATAPGPSEGVLHAGDINRCNNAALRKATRRVSQLYDSMLAPTGLRSTQRSILLNIERLGAPSLGQLAASLVLDRSALGHNLRPLERDGFIELFVDPADRRNRLVRLTKKGESKLRETAAFWQAAQDRFESTFGVVQAKALRDALAIIAAQELDQPNDWDPSLTRAGLANALALGRSKKI